MAKSSIGAAAALVMGLSGAACQADQSAELWRFARSNAGLFAPEIKAPRRTFTVAIPSADVLPRDGRYDYAKGELRMSSAELFSIPVAERCTTTGSFVGSNAFGASRTVTARKCDKLVVIDQGQFRVGEIDCLGVEAEDNAAPGDSDYEVKRAAACKREGRFSIGVKMSPGEYRRGQARGLIVEIEFEPGPGATDEVVQQTRTKFDARIDYPYETMQSRWTVNGVVRQVRLLTDDGKRELARFERRG